MTHLTFSRFVRLLPRIIAVFIFLYGFLWIRGYPRKWEDADSPPTTEPSFDPQAPALEEVVVSIKTGATEAYDKLPPQLLLTNPQDHDNLLLFSDLEEDIGDFHLYDVLSRFDPAEMEHNRDFDIYRKIQHYDRLGLDIRLLKDEKDPNPDWRTRGHNAAWALDKYKFLHMLERAWELKPDRQWYVFIETDTYLVRPNLMSFLGQYDSNVPHYFGNPTQNPHYSEGDTYEFGHGGSGFIISRAAMHQLLVEKQGVISAWDPVISGMWFGDYVVAAALHDEIGLNITGAWPLLSGLKPTTIPYGPDVWCQPVVALHHVRPEEQSDIWRFEREREEVYHMPDPFTFEDLYRYFLEAEDLLHVRDDWDNLSSDFSNKKYNIRFEKKEKLVATEEHLHNATEHSQEAFPEDESFEACKAACYANQKCAQFLYTSAPFPNFNENGETKCHLSSSFRLGTRKDVEVFSDKKGNKVHRSWRSGWRKGRFDKWASQQRCNNR